MEKLDQSILEQVVSSKPLRDEEVLSRAFGIEIMKESVPENVVLVEGKCDKVAFEMFFHHFSEKINYSIESAGGCSKVYSIASILAAENFKRHVFWILTMKQLKLSKIF